MALSRLPFVNLSWAYYRFDSPLVRRFDPFIHDHPIDHPPFIRPSIRWIWNVVAGCNGRLTIPRCPSCKFLQGPFRASFQGMVCTSRSIHSDGLTRSRPHRTRIEQSSILDIDFLFEQRAAKAVKGVNCEVQNRCVYWREYVARMVNVYPVRGEKENMCDSRVRASVCLFESDEREIRQRERCCW